ncbi:fungal-specific transcription factor domain-containing protein [Paraphoma chrysanthemicola]|uniref:Fungal-specific transcription factor domain-containing protein n=1 Tax=Paraphoma chrysanthemicola TaxID=798071 RepID=A0A8K0W0Z6_9PLEO|nr:fungal-specific transcription factor domain-containing protein [Paraphoma chrysanthemicola]
MENSPSDTGIGSLDQESAEIENLALSSLSSQHAASPTHAEPLPNGKRKREKYTGKACGPCKKRKIKCGGGTPCVACVRRKRPCTSSDPEPPRPQSTDLEQSNTTEAEPVRILQNRMAALESQLTTLNQALLRMAPILESNESNTGFANSERQSQQWTHRNATPRSTTSGVSPKDGLTFVSGKNGASTTLAGETSVVHALRRVEDQLGLPIAEDRGSVPRTPPMTPMISTSRDWNDTNTPQKVPQLLRKYGITPNRQEWDVYLETFLVEVYPLYPFLSEEMFREMYEELWNSIDADTTNDHAVQALLVLANGRCATSSRIQSDAGSNSAGWSLYRAAMEMQGSLLDTVNDDSNPLSSLHSLTLVVIYLLRLDATERAQKVLSLAIVHAHHLGIHLNQIHANIPETQSVLFKRVWWCMYVLDRRLALVLGRPFLIHDNNIHIDIEDSLELQQKTDNHDLERPDRNAAPERTEQSPVHYLHVMVGYSRVVGKVWETLFGSKSCEDDNPHIYEYLDCLVHDWMGSVPEFLLCDADDVHRSSIPLTQALFKQRFLIRLRYLSILNVIRSPIRRFKTRTAAKLANDIEAEAICLRQARCIVDMFAQCSLADGVYGFPFLPYLLESTIVMLACLTRLPYLKQAYRKTIESAMDMLMKFYRKTWVSGKVARIIFQLSKIIPHVFAGTNAVPSNTAPKAHDMTRTESENIGFFNEGAPVTSETLPANPANRHFRTPSDAWVQNNRPQDVWHAKRPEPNVPTFRHDYHENFSIEQSVPEHDQAEFSFQFDDFPFELGLTNTAPQNPVLPGHNNLRSSVRPEVSAGQSVDAYNMDWLQELIGQDGRNLFEFS